jgi:hypothetical protein
MINLLFLLAIAQPHVSASTLHASEGAVNTSSIENQCDEVVDAWKAFGKETALDPNDPIACCYKLGNQVQSSGIPGVDCTSYGLVTRIDWNNRNLTGEVPDYISFLHNLIYL